MKSLRPILLIAGVTLSIAALSGCSAINDVATVQSKVQGCATISQQLKSVGTGIDSQLSKLQTDPTAAAASIAKTTVAFSTAAGKVKNPQVKAVAHKTAVALTTFSSDLTAVAKNPTQAGATQIQTDATSLQASLTKLSSTCKL